MGVATGCGCKEVYTVVPEILAGIILGGLRKSRRKLKLADFNLVVFAFRYVMLLRKPPIRQI